MKKQDNMGLVLLLKSASEFFAADEILEREVISMGNSAAVRIPKKHLGKKVKVLIIRNKSEGKL